jgi:multidrug resistance efflux pump
MGEPTPLRGHVQSIVAGIEDRDRTQGSNLLPNVNPAFSWVRLAQRIPVRVALDEVPADFRMIAGRTATVSVRDLSPVRRRPVSGTGAASGTVAASAAAVAPGSAVASGSAASAAASSGASQ